MRRPCTGTRWPLRQVCARQRAAARWSSETRGTACRTRDRPAATGSLDHPDGAGQRIAQRRDGGGGLFVGNVPLQTDFGGARHGGRPLLDLAAGGARRGQHQGGPGDPGDRRAREALPHERGGAARHGDLHAQGDRAHPLGRPSEGGGEPAPLPPVRVRRDHPDSPSIPRL